MLTIFFRNGKVDHYHESILGGKEFFCDKQHPTFQSVKVASCLFGGPVTLLIMNG